MPYIKLMPYKSTADDIALSSTYFIPASVDFKLSLSKAVRMIKDIVISSRPI